MSRATPQAGVRALWVAVLLVSTPYIACGVDEGTRAPPAEDGPAPDQGSGGAAAGSPAAFVPSPPLPPFVAAYLAANAAVEQARCLARARAYDTPLASCDPGTAEPGRRAVDLLLAARVSFREERAAPCVAAQAQVQTPADLPAADASCAPLLEPLSPPGARCADGTPECREGFCEAAAGCFGACAPWKTAGEACRRDDHCAAGLRCAGTICVDQAQGRVPQAPCAAATDCEGEVYCDLAVLVCVLVKPSGAACGSGAECASAICRQGGCVLPDDGEPCDPGAPCAGDLRCIARFGQYRCAAPSPEYCAFEAEFRCAAGERCVDHRCDAAPKPPAGEACLLGYCAAGLVCRDKVCNLPDRAGTPCAGEKPTECGPSGSCLEGTCGEPLAEGAACALGQRCSLVDNLVCAAGVCTRKKHLADACDRDADACDSFTFCGPEKTCVPRTPTLLPCTEDRECESRVCVGGNCRPSCRETP